MGRFINSSVSGSIKSLGLVSWYLKMEISKHTWILTMKIIPEKDANTCN